MSVRVPHLQRLPNGLFNHLVAKTSTTVTIYQYHSHQSMVLTRLLAVSLVDGYNLPIRIDNNQGCGVADCPVDLVSNCTLTSPNLLLFIPGAHRPVQVQLYCRVPSTLQDLR